MHFLTRSNTASKTEQELRKSPTSVDSFQIDSVVERGLLLNCGNPNCRSGWLHLTRSRSWPIFESYWTCSPECTAAQIAMAVARELNGRVVAEPHQHRVPLGLLMLQQGWITPSQLKRARDAQNAGGGRLGTWLVRGAGISEAQLTRALSMQWNCPVLPMEISEPEALTALLPRLFSETLSALPLRVAARRLLYLGCEQNPNPVLALGLERMTGLRVESGLVNGSRFQAAHCRYLAARFPEAEFFEAVSESALVRVLTNIVERSRPIQARLIRVHDWLWMRLWRKESAGPVPECADVRDVICNWQRL